jgi:hypothetical protein
MITLMRQSDFDLVHVGHEEQRLRWDRLGEQLGHLRGRVVRSERETYDACRASPEKSADDVGVFSPRILLQRERESTRRNVGGRDPKRTGDLPSRTPPVETERDGAADDLRAIRDLEDRGEADPLVADRASLRSIRNLLGRAQADE